MKIEMKLGWASLILLTFVFFVFFVVEPALCPLQVQTAMAAETELAAATQTPSPINDAVPFPLASRKLGFVFVLIGVAILTFRQNRGQCTAAARFSKLTRALRRLTASTRAPAEPQTTVPTRTRTSA